MSEEKFEEAMQRLEGIVQDLETGDLSLSDSIKVFEEGMKLARFCSKELEAAEKKVSLLIQEGGGKVRETPFEVDGALDEQ